MNYVENNKLTALYTRVSTDEQAAHGTSLLDQERDLIAWAKYKNLPYQIFSDDGYSGTTIDRPGLKSIMNGVRTGKIDKLVVTKLDRLMRNLKLILELIDEFKKNNVTFLSLSENLDTSTAYGKFALSIMGAVAEFEREQIIDRTRRGRQSRYRDGKWGPGQPPYGYKYNKKTKYLEIKSEEAKVVQRIFDMYVNLRFGLERIARQLNSDHIPPRQNGRRWHTAAIRDIVLHPAYKGEHPTGAKCPVIISHDIWDIAQKLRSSNRHLYRREGSPWLLQGITRCGLCGYALGCSYSHGKSGRRVYSCRGRLIGTNSIGSSKCALLPIDAEWLEASIWEKAFEILSNPDALQSELQKYISQLDKRKSELEQAVRPIKFRLDEIKEQQSRLADDYVKLKLDAKQWHKTKSELDLEEKQLLAMQTNFDPNQLDELLRTEAMLSFWKDIDKFQGNDVPKWAKDAQKKLESEIGKDGVDLHYASMELISDWKEEFLNYYNDIEDEDERSAKALAAAKARFISSTHNKRNLLDGLQSEVVVFPSKIELRGAISFTIENPKSMYDPDCRLIRCLRFL